MVTLETELLVGQVAAVKAQLVHALQAWASPDSLRLDCSALEAVDGAGLQLLATLGMTLQERGGRLVLLGCRPALRQRIELAALQAWFEFEALEAA
jgi:anti-anti-sigma factor